MDGPLHKFERTLINDHFDKLTKIHSKFLHIQGVSKKHGPFLKMPSLFNLWRKLFQIFFGSSKLIHI